MVYHHYNYSGVPNKCRSPNKKHGWSFFDNGFLPFSIFSTLCWIDWNFPNFDKKIFWFVFAYWKFFRETGPCQSKHFLKTLQVFLPSLNKNETKMFESMFIWHFRVLSTNTFDNINSKKER